MSIEGNFDKTTTIIIQDYKKYESIVKESFSEARVLPLKDFNKNYDKDKLLIDKEMSTAVRKIPTVEFFTNAFKNLEQYPTNLQKLKTKSPKNAYAKQILDTTIISKSSTSLLGGFDGNNTQHKEKHRSSLNLTKLEDLPSASDIYKDFQTFQAQLQQLNYYVNDRKTEKKYITKLEHINNFTQQMEKLVPKVNGAELAVSVEEENRLKQLLKEVEDVSVTQACESSLRHKTYHSDNGSLENLLNIVSHCLRSLNF